MDQKEIKEALKQSGGYIEPMPMKYPKIIYEKDIKAKAFDYLKQELDYCLDEKMSEEEINKTVTDRVVTIADFIDLLLGE